ncbi:hypothetical protein GWK47_045827 [Chionoecetes opilio]|uniref:Uncharacterized protein n=1 Tax=Chionoecetes opilio TaxID=41210 RepID=A0A8J4Y6S8_CHIOP|nr:hypothetical protein GWK47_045827 [Chionoecetes opilio]
MWYMRDFRHGGLNLYPTLHHTPELGTSVPLSVLRNFKLVPRSSGDAQCHASVPSGRPLMGLQEGLPPRPGKDELPRQEGWPPALLGGSFSRKDIVTPEVLSEDFATETLCRGKFPDQVLRHTAQVGTSSYAVDTKLRPPTTPTAVTAQQPGLP